MVGQPGRSADVTDPADLGVVAAASLLRAGALSATELVSACLRRIEHRDGTHSAAGDPASVNAWIRVYAEAALADAARADDLLSAKATRDGTPPPLCGVPIGLKDLYAVAGRPVTASSALLHEVPSSDSEVWRRLRGAGMVLLGHTHTHEFAAGGTTDQVGNPHRLDRSAGGSSGGSAAALAAGMVPATTGTDTAGSLRIPAALCGVATIKPTRGLVPITGVVPLAFTLDHCGPMARTVEDCAALLAVMAGPDPGDAMTAVGARDRPQPGTGLAGVRIAVSPRLARRRLDDDVRESFDWALRLAAECGATVLDPDPEPPEAEADAAHLTVLCTEMLSWHRRFEGQRDRYQPSTRQLLELGERAALSGADYAQRQLDRRTTTRRWANYLAERSIDVLVEPTVPVVAPIRGTGYERAGSDAELVSLTYLWNWTGFPVVAVPAGRGRSTGLPVGVSLIGAPGSDQLLLSAGADLQRAMADG